MERDFPYSSHRRRRRRRCATYSQCRSRARKEIKEEIVFPLH